MNDLDFNIGHKYIFLLMPIVAVKAALKCLKSARFFKCTRLSCLKKLLATLESIFSRPSARALLRLYCLVAGPTKVIYWHFFLASHILMMVGC